MPDSPLILRSIRRPAFVRAAPFAAFMVVLALRGFMPADGSIGIDTRWLYALQVLLPAAMLALWWRDYGELSAQTTPTLREALLAAAVGVLVFGLWINLDAPWMTLNAVDASAYVPLTAAGTVDWPLVALRLAGATLLVPVMEELFWRSFLMRWLKQPIFESVLPATVGLRAIVLSTFVFVLAHTLWLAAAIAGLAYALLYVRTGKLWTAVIAHALTNALLGVYVVATGAWQFW
ncbi:MAG: CAAX prenyl protease-related protein [Pseudomonadota bacterium]|nr:CAAX prenyl protease-related protein [Pseudomonadota bacterium]